MSKPGAGLRLRDGGVFDPLRRHFEAEAGLRAGKGRLQTADKRSGQAGQ
jgi:hypothetical protein